MKNTIYTMKDLRKSVLSKKTDDIFLFKKKDHQVLSFSGVTLKIYSLLAVCLTQKTDGLCLENTFWNQVETIKSREKANQKAETL